MRNSLQVARINVTLKIVAVAIRTCEGVTAGEDAVVCTTQSDMTRHSTIELHSIKMGTIRVTTTLLTTLVTATTTSRMQSKAISTGNASSVIKITFPQVMVGQKIWEGSRESGN
jgi:hypothetical protein